MAGYNQNSNSGNKYGGGKTGGFQRGGAPAATNTNATLVKRNKVFQTGLFSPDMKKDGSQPRHVAEVKIKEAVTLPANSKIYLYPADSDSKGKKVFSISVLA